MSKFHRLYFQSYHNGKRGKLESVKGSMYFTELMNEAERITNAPQQEGYIWQPTNTPRRFVLSYKGEKVKELLIL